MWTSFEFAQLGVEALAPVLVVIVGLALNRSVKRLEQAQWGNQKIIEKRLALYDEIAPDLNKLYCFYMWVGYWKDVSPKDVVDTKRKLDTTVNIYRHLMSRDFYTAYEGFIDLLFLTYSGTGEDAKIRSAIIGPLGDRSIHANYIWERQWDSSFAPPDQAAPPSEIDAQYHLTMEAFRDCLGVDRDQA
jgi:hypothetical protein